MEILVNSHIEDDHQKALFKWAANIPELRWMHAIPNGGKRNVREAARLKAQGTKSGVWDIFLPIPTNGYHGLYIEMKAGKNKLTKNQHEFGDFVHKQGYLTHTAYSWLEAKQVICDYMGYKPN